MKTFKVKISDRDDVWHNFDFVIRIDTEDKNYLILTFADGDTTMLLHSFVRIVDIIKN